MDEGNSNEQRQNMAGDQQNSGNAGANNTGNIQPAGGQDRQDTGQDNRSGDSDAAVRPELVGDRMGDNPVDSGMGEVAQDMDMPPSGTQSEGQSDAQVNRDGEKGRDRQQSSQQGDQQSERPGEGSERKMDDEYYDSSATKNKPGLNNSEKE